MNDTLIMVFSLAQPFEPLWKTVPVGDFLWSYNDRFFSLEIGDEFGMGRYRLDLRGLERDLLGQDDWASLMESVLNAYNTLRQKYPLYVLVGKDQPDIVAHLSRIGAIAYLGEWAGRTKEESEQDWTEMTETLRSLDTKKG